MQNPKRKDIFDAQPRETSKRHPLEPHSPWNNLNLILCIQDKHHGVLSHGLFHHMHIPEFLSLHVSENDDASCDDKSNDSKATIKSYARHLFDVLNKIIAKKNDMAMGSLGLLFHLYVNSTRKFKLDEGHQTVEK